MYAIFADLIKRGRERARLVVLGNDSFGQLAHDIDVSKRELEFLINELHEPKQLTEMLKVLRIDEAALGRARPTLLRHMQRTCGLCDVTNDCQHALDRGSAASTYRAFCPNAHLLNALTAYVAH